MFYETVERMEENTTLTKYQQLKAIAVLEDAGVIRTERRGLPAKRYFAINEEKLLEVVDNKKSKNWTTGSEKTEHQESEFFDVNKNREEKEKREIKNRDIRESGSSAPTTTAEKKPKRKSSPTVTDDTATELMADTNISEPLRDKVHEWLQYKSEIGDSYKTTGFKTLLRQVEHAEQRHGATAVMNQIDVAMASTWHGMFLEKIQRKSAYGNNKAKNSGPSLDVSLERFEHFRSFGS
jgi:DNA-binding PadR family transcriptional regulator